MKIVKDSLWLCLDCLIAAENGDYGNYGLTPAESEKREKEIREGLAKLGKYLAPNFNSETGEGIREFSFIPCSCCGMVLGGSRHRYSILGEDEQTEEQDDLNDPEAVECPVCGSEAFLLGYLGRLQWFRCRYCGMEFNQEVS